MEKIIMGIDPSMRSTGICINDGSNFIYHLIVSHATKKVLACDHPRLSIYKYEPVQVSDKNSIQKETAKTDNVRAVVDYIKTLLAVYRPDMVIMEAVAYAASGRIDELAGLNYCIRLACKDIPVYVVPPTTNKLQFTGNGQATKEMMIEGWKGIDPDIYKLENVLGKHAADLADACSLSLFQIENFH